MEEKKQSLFKRIGGKEAVNAAVEIFYKKVIKDESIKHFFDKTDMKAQIEKQKMFLTYAFGGLPNYSGKGMREAHKHMDIKNIHYEAVVKHLFDTLIELNVNEKLMAEVAAITYTTKEAILNKRMH